MKHVFKSIVLLMILSLLAGCVSIPIGDGKSIKFSKDGFEFTSKDGEKQTFKVDGDENEPGFTMTGTDEDGEEQSVSIGQTKEVPKDFPKAIPLPSESELESAMNMNLGEESQYMLYYNFNEKLLDKYIQTYKDFADKNGYENASETTANGYYNLILEKENESINITASSDSDESDEMTLIITYLQAEDD